MRSAFRIVLAISAFVIGDIRPALAGPFEDGMAANQRGDYAAALADWRPLADQGNPDAQFRIGAMYELGRGVVRDHAQAKTWFIRAAENGSAISQLTMASMYVTGHDEAVDYVQAYAWASLGARHYPQAKSTLALLTKNLTPAQVDEAKQIATALKAAHPAM
jgi:uncharacterized protein